MSFQENEAAQAADTDNSATTDASAQMHSSETAGVAEAPQAELEGPTGPTFADLHLSEDIQGTLEEIGYEHPSPIQAGTIPPLLAGLDVLGQAQTGTGKTAAFALPVLNAIDLNRREPQAIVLAPTRELAIQVAEAFQKYAKNLPGFHVLPIYGGQAYPLQLRPLQRGVHVIVGTPGRVMDHIKRGSLDLSTISHVVLDEADEMLKMGFVDDVMWILEHAPKERQTALFSATMPPVIQRMATDYMRNPEVIKLEMRTTIAETITQRYEIMAGHLKLDALTRLLEVEEFEAMIIFVRTKANTVELAEKLAARGHAVTALNGDIPQRMREQTVNQLKAGKIDIVVATDVAARGLDVERITHVVNYDLPTDLESYTHRIGRTGRAGRAGMAILFVKPRERRLLRDIERATSSRLERLEVPGNDEVNKSRIERFKRRIGETIEAYSEEKSSAQYASIISEYIESTDSTQEQVFGALARLAQGDQTLFFQADGRQQGRVRSEDERRDFRERGGRGNDRFGDRGGRNDRGGNFNRGDRGGSFDRGDRGGSFDRGGRPERGGRFDRGGQSDRGGRFERGGRDERGGQQFGGRDQGRPEATSEAGMNTFRIEVGHRDGVNPGNIVGAVANEGDISSQYIGRIQIFDQFSTIDLPDGMPQETFRRLQETRVRGQKLRIAKLGEEGGDRPQRGQYSNPRDRR
ncbi:MAG: DEAD/DEAH box helicase [Planctomycetota bacterium]|nr:DEAD/DEAH box helicase [Planctomycetota bacterium]